MFNKVSKSILHLYHGKKGITGLETAIILIAFVTVAAVLAYTVLSAGIFSSERGKEAVYSGLNSAQSTMDVKGSVIGTNLSSVDDETGEGASAMTLQFTLAMAIGGGTVDLTKMTFNYWDSKGNMVNGIQANIDTVADPDVPAVDFDGATSLSGSDQALVTVKPLFMAGLTPVALAAYDTFTLQIIPPTGATITIQRTLPGAISGLVNLN